MPVIRLNEEQAKLINEALEPIEFRDPEGRLLARGASIDLEAIERAKQARASNSPSIPCEVVQAHMRALQEAADQGMNEEELWALHLRLKQEETQ